MCLFFVDVIEFDNSSKLFKTKKIHYFFGVDPPAVEEKM